VVSVLLHLALVDREAGVRARATLGTQILAAAEVGQVLEVQE
jgi:hypothetical protein